MRSRHLLLFAHKNFLANRIAHARSGDSVRISGYCGDADTLDRALSEFAEAYGDQTEQDHAALVKAIKTGRVKAIEVSADE